MTDNYERQGQTLKETMKQVQGDAFASVLGDGDEAKSIVAVPVMLNLFQHLSFVVHCVLSYDLTTLATTKPIVAVPVMLNLFQHLPFVVHLFFLLLL
ncbi:MAG: hypothetical protein LBO62_07715 [Endomicrobium sp.]|jgi:hypothetical protein|nr:hypothetical protein [Endomicrobium sp.]